jgi:hypothetical protein
MKVEDVRKRAYDLQVWAEEQMGSIDPEYNNTVEGGIKEICKNTKDIQVLYTDFICIKLATGYNSGIKVASAINIYRLLDGDLVDATPAKYTVFNTRTNYVGVTLAEFTNMGVEAAKAKVLEMKDSVISGVYPDSETVTYNNAPFVEVTDDAEDSCKPQYEIFAEWVNINICSIGGSILVANEDVPQLGSTARPSALKVKYTKNGIAVKDILDNTNIDNKIYTIKDLAINPAVTEYIIATTKTENLESLYKTVVNYIQNNRMGMSTTSKPEELWNSISNPGVTTGIDEYVTCVGNVELTIACSDYVCKVEGCTGTTTTNPYKYATKITFTYKYITSLSYLPTRTIERNFSIYNNISSSTYTTLTGISAMTAEQINASSFTRANIENRINSIIAGGKLYYGLPNTIDYQWNNSCTPIVDDNDCNIVLTAELANWNLCGICSVGTGWLSSLKKVCNSRIIATGLKVTYYQGNTSKVYYKDLVDNSDINAKIYSIHDILGIQQGELAAASNQNIQALFAVFINKVQTDRLGITNTNCLSSKIDNRSLYIVSGTGCDLKETKTRVFSDYVCSEIDSTIKIATKITVTYKYNENNTLNYINAINVTKTFTIYEAISGVHAAITESSLKNMSIAEITTRWNNIVDYIHGESGFNIDGSTFTTTGDYTILDSLDECKQSNKINTLLYYDTICSTAFASGVSTTIRITKTDAVTGVVESGYPKTIKLKKSNGNDYTDAELKALTLEQYNAAIDSTFEWLKVNEGVTQEEINNIQGDKFVSKEYEYTPPSSDIERVTAVFNVAKYTGRYLIVLKPLAQINASKASDDYGDGAGDKYTYVPLHCANLYTLSRMKLIMSNVDSNDNIYWWSTTNYLQWGAIGNTAGSIRNHVAEAGVALQRSVSGNVIPSTLWLDKSTVGTSGENYIYSVYYYSCTTNKKITILAGADNGLEVSLNGVVVAKSASISDYYKGCGSPVDFAYSYLFEISSGFIIGNNRIDIKYTGDATTNDYLYFVGYDCPISDITASHVDDTLDIIFDSRWMYGIELKDYTCQNGYDRNVLNDNCRKVINDCGGTALSCNDEYQFNIMGYTDLVFYRLGGGAKGDDTGNWEGFFEITGLDTGSNEYDKQGRIRRSWFRVTSRKGDKSTGGGTFVEFTAQSSNPEWLKVVKSTVVLNKIYICCSFNDTNMDRTGMVTLTQTATNNIIKMRFTQYALNISYTYTVKPSTNNVVDIYDVCDT